MKRLRKIALWVLGVTAVLLVAGWFGLKAYVNSSAVRRQAGTQLGEIIGLPVEVDSLSVGTSSTSAEFHVPEGGSSAGDLLKVGSVETDVTLMQLVSGAVAPTRITLKDAELFLRIDADGKILSPLPTLKAGKGGPKALPKVHLVNGRVRIQQAGHPEFSLGGITAELHRDGDKYALVGDVADPKWGAWKVNGLVAADPLDGKVVLRSEKTEFQDELLRSIPYVPTSVWDEVRPTQTSGVTVAFTLRPGRGLGYEVDLAPQKATLAVPAISTTLTDVEGDVKVADGKVTFKNGRGSIADGAVTLDGAYAFDQPTGVLTMKVTAKGVDLQKLPAEWGVPKQITGKLRGNADLEIHLPPGKPVDTRGSGRGDVEGAQLAGIPAQIQLRLHAETANPAHLPHVPRPADPPTRFEAGKVLSVRAAQNSAERGMRPRAAGSGVAVALAFSGDVVGGAAGNFYRRPEHDDRARNGQPPPRDAPDGRRLVRLRHRHRHRTAEPGRLARHPANCSGRRVRGRRGRAEGAAGVGPGRRADRGDGRQPVGRRGRLKFPQS